MALTTLWCEMLLHRDILREDHDASEAMKVLDRVFLCREADTVAFDLIGYHLNWRYCGKSESRIITETEAYIGAHD